VTIAVGFWLARPAPATAAGFSVSRAAAEQTIWAAWRVRGNDEPLHACRSACVRMLRAGRDAAAAGGACGLALAWP
jgi:hypothetical protein